MESISLVEGNNITWFHRKVHVFHMVLEMLILKKISFQINT